MTIEFETKVRNAVLWSCRFSGCDIGGMSKISSDEDTEMKALAVNHPLRDISGAPTAMHSHGKILDLPGGLRSIVSGGLNENVAHGIRADVPASAHHVSLARSALRPLPGFLPNTPPFPKAQMPTNASANRLAPLRTESVARSFWDNLQLFVCAAVKALSPLLAVDGSANSTCRIGG